MILRGIGDAYTDFEKVKEDVILFGSLVEMMDMRSRSAQLQMRFVPVTLVEFKMCTKFSHYLAEFGIVKS